MSKEVSGPPSDAFVLTSRVSADTTFNQNFLLTFKSFMTVDELFHLLVKRFYIQAPPNLSPAEFEEWTKLKQSIIRLRCVFFLRTQSLLVNEVVYIGCSISSRRWSRTTASWRRATCTS